MHARWLVLLALLAVAGTAGYGAARRWGLGAAAGEARARPIPPGCHEIAWIAPATSSDSWERLVAALRQLQQDWPKLQPGTALDINLDKAFLDLTTDVPEIALGPAGSSARLWIRWYKLSGENDSERWVANLRERGAPPLAVVGGDTSDHALALAQALRDARDSWAGPAPLLLITTATADRYAPKERDAAPPSHEDWPTLIGVYPGRSFRFAFTNTRMVEAVLDFVRQMPQVWPQKNSDPGVFAGAAAAGNPWTSLSLLKAAGYLRPYFLYTLAWGDDRYSSDLAETFSKLFTEQFASTLGKDEAVIFDAKLIPYSVGDQFQPNPRERLAIDWFLNNRGALRDQQHLLAVPTGAQRARRFLRTLCQRAPGEMRNVVVVNGDAISFNTIYRDRDVAWNILDLPVPLVFFSHRNPIDPSAGFDPNRSTTGTQDLLLFRDILEALLHAGFENGRLVADADKVRDRMSQLRWRFPHVYPQGIEEKQPPSRPFFDGEGNRHASTGEHIVWLQPAYEDTRNLPRAAITVWHVAGAGWAMSGRPLDVLYNRASAEGIAAGD
jgi:hypothetical protein